MIQAASYMDLSLSNAVLIFGILRLPPSQFIFECFNLLLPLMFLNCAGLHLTLMNHSPRLLCLVSLQDYIQFKLLAFKL